MNSDHELVRSWLESVFGKDHAVPNYEVNETNLASLLDLARLSQSRERDLRTLQALQRRQIEEYRAEADRICRNLSAVGLSPEGGGGGGDDQQQQLSGRPVETFVEVVAEVSHVLGLDDPTEAEMSISLADVQIQSGKIPPEDARRGRREKEGKARMLETLKELGQVQGVARTVAESEARERESAARMQKQLGFLREKHREYAKTAKKREAILRESRFGKDVQHETIVDLKERLTSLEAELLPLKAKLDGYQSLPPDLELARAKVAEAQGELDALTRQLTEEISVLHI